MGRDNRVGPPGVRRATVIDPDEGRVGGSVLDGPGRRWAVGSAVVAASLLLGVGGGWWWVGRSGQAAVRDVEALGIPAQGLTGPAAVVVSYPDCEQPQCVSAVRTWTPAGGMTLSGLDTALAPWVLAHGLSGGSPWTCDLHGGLFGVRDGDPGCGLAFVLPSKTPVFLAVTFAGPNPPRFASIQQEDSATTLARYGHYRLRSVCLQVVSGS